MVQVDFKTVHFAQLNTHEQSGKRSGARLKTKSETGERFFFSRLTRLDIDFEGKKTDCFAVYGLSSFYISLRFSRS